ncbi:MAG TPA: N-acetyltransferase [Casimicrobiaceae bacterium]|nr:N-acetyltransferase [Casimicrobiaceae bacterium]
MTVNALTIRRATVEDAAAIWAILEPVFRAGETYAIARDISREKALEYWFAPAHEVFVAEADGVVSGTYCMRANQAGGGSHVANCGYVTSPAAQGRGVARQMLEHSLVHARSRGFLAMQFNFVVSTNARAIKTWESYGFTIVGRLPLAYNHPTRGLVDALVMYRAL